MSATEPSEAQRLVWAEEAAARLRAVGYSEEQIEEMRRWKAEARAELAAERKAKEKP
jgi:hypothetical protein